jgi:superoxide dismutase
MYYIDFHNEQLKYIEGFWHLLNRDFVAQKFARAKAPQEHSS